MPRLYGELAKWPSKDKMAKILRSAGLAVNIGRYSISIESKHHFKFQEYGGDLGDPVIDADSDDTGGFLSTIQIVSGALADANIVHRFEVYDDQHEMIAYASYNWPVSNSK